MGNHDAGRAMVHTAVALRENTDLPALEILDKSAEPARGRDAEFDDATDPDHTFGRLLIEAFAPGQTFDVTTEQGEEHWYSQVIEPFSKRYGLW